MTTKKTRPSPSARPDASAAGRRRTDDRNTRSLHAAQSRVLELVATGVSLPVVLDYLSRVVEAHAEGARASILLHDGATPRIRVASAPSLPPAYARRLDGAVMPDGAGACGPALRRGEAVVTRDVYEAPAWRGYHDLARDGNIRSGWSTPILSSHGELRGTLALYREHVGEPSGEDLAVARKAAHLAGIAVERAQADAEVARVRRDLERRVGERTRALQVVNAELEAFTSTVAHDLRAPLRGIDYFATLLSEEASDQLSDEERDWLHRLREESRRAAQLVTDLLDFSRAATREIRGEEIDVTRMANDVVDRLAHGEPGRDIAVHVQEGLRGRADADLARIALDNLLANAWKYTRRAAAPEIRVEEIVRDDGRWIVVRDNGAGFDPAQTGRLFAPFTRLHAGQFEGTGIGLATAARIARRHGGDVWAHSGGPGRGASFGIRFEREAPGSRRGAP